MKAVTIQQHGGPEVVQVREVPDPQPAAGEVLIDIRAAALLRTRFNPKGGIA